MNSGEQLCLACGMCCDGTLFDNVRLDPDEDASGLKALGLAVKLSRAKTPVSFLTQPCSALCSDCTCRIYTERPKQCRSFECGVFKEASSGQITYDAAHRLVKQTRRKADKVRRLLQDIGEVEEKLSLGKRFKRVQRRIESGSADQVAGGIFADLGLAIHKLDLLAHQRFYTEEEDDT